MNTNFDFTLLRDDTCDCAMCDPQEDEDCDMHDADPDDHIMTRAEYLDAVKYGALIDYDGYGHPATPTVLSDGSVIFSYDTSRDLYPSEIKSLPDDVTHVVWFNR